MSAQLLFKCLFVLSQLFSELHIFCIILISNSCSYNRCFDSGLQSVHINICDVHCALVLYLSCKDSLVMVNQFNLCVHFLCYMISKFFNSNYRWFAIILENVLATHLQNMKPKRTSFRKAAMTGLPKSTLHRLYHKINQIDQPSSYTF